jgi:hypothetical protein
MRYSIEGKTAVNDHGILQIPWPSLDGNIPVDNIDLLLATATRPSKPLPDEPMLARTWREHGSDYFWQNREHGIHTYQDTNIEELLRAAL